MLDKIAPIVTVAKLFHQFQSILHKNSNFLLVIENHLDLFNKINNLN